MKTIYLIRHAKSDWDNPELSDFERVLNNKGIKDALLMGEKINDLGFNPELIVCSPAKRTTTTAQLICQQTSLLFEHIQYNKSIYEASLTDLTHLVNTLPNQNNTVAIIGHNPAITLLSNYLTDDYIDNMPPCSIVKIELEIDAWNEIITGIGAKKFFISPESL